MEQVLDSELTSTKSMNPRDLNVLEARPRISVVSPVYMAERILPVLVERLDTVLTQLSDCFEVILVCDGSPDNSWFVMQDLVRQYPHLKIVNLSRNFGQHYAITAGMDLARGDWTVVMDCDLQDRPEDIPRLFAKLDEGYDMVVARRIDRQHKWWKRVTSRLYFKIFSLLSGFELDGSVGTFRVMSRGVVDAYCSMRETYRMFAGLIEWLGFRTGFIDLQHGERFEGDSSYDLPRLIRMAMDGMISFSNRPLHISIGLGLSLSLLSTIYGLSLIVKYIMDPETFGVPGWLTTVTTTTFIGGLLLLNHGLLGLYLGRLYNEAKRRPLYVIQNVVIGAAFATKEAGEEEHGRDAN